MNRCVHFLALAVLFTAASNSSAVDQFYSNGRVIDGWNDVRTTSDPEGPYFWTIHFFKKNPTDTFYAQNVAKKYKNPRDPNKKDKIFFFSQDQGVFTGSYDINAGEYSVLPRHLRRPRLEDIHPASFPKPNGMPQLYEMGRKNCEPRRPDYRELADPPATPE